MFVKCKLWNILWLVCWCTNTIIPCNLLGVFVCLFVFYTWYGMGLSFIQCWNWKSDSLHSLVLFIYTFNHSKSKSGLAKSFINYKLSECKWILYNIKYKKRRKILLGWCTHVEFYHKSHSIRFNNENQK